MRDDETRVCRLCGGNPKPKSEFYSGKLRDGTPYVRNECKECMTRKTTEYHRQNRDRVILNNCRKGDRTLGLETTLTRAEIRSLISKPCEYCGDKNDRMGVDRVDNAIGHQLDNCVPCCIRCNMLKRDMPTEAWRVLAPAVRKVFRSGLFGNWVGHNAGSQTRGRRQARKPKLPDRRLKENRGIRP